MPGPPVLNGPFTMPMFHKSVPRAIQPWIYVLFAFCFQLSGSLYAGALSHYMGSTCLMREDIMMIVLCGVIGVNMPFPFLFRFKFHFTNRQLLINAAVIIAVCNFLSMQTETVPILCALSYVAGFFKLCGTFECMSNIQLWMTPKRNFAIFFPLLYCIVLGDMSLSPWLTVKLTYIFQSWQAMHWFMIGLMTTVALAVYTLTHPFRFMKPLPFISLDWLGCLLWSALMIEIVFLFNYGEYYNWWNSRVFRTVTCTVPVTLWLIIGRMRHIRHPYLSIDAWKYRKLIPLMGLFVLVELVNSTSKSLQGTFTSSVLHFGTITTLPFYLVEWIGTVSGCLFVMLWIKVLHQNYTRLLTIGVIALLGYEVLMYFQISPNVNIERLYLPIYSRTFGVALFFTALTIYLEEVIPFQHFFMGLTMIGLIRNGVVETVCSGLYNFLMRHHIADNLQRGLPYEPLQALMISLKQLFGVTCIIAAVVLMVFLLWDIPPVRSTMKKLPDWNTVGQMMKKNLFVELKAKARAR